MNRRQVAQLGAYVFVVAMGAVGFWSVQQEGWHRQERICEAFDRYTTFLGHEVGASDGRIDDARHRIAVLLEC